MEGDLGIYLLEMVGDMAALERNKQSWPTPIQRISEKSVGVRRNQPRLLRFHRNTPFESGCVDRIVTFFLASRKEESLKFLRYYTLV